MNLVYDGTFEGFLTCVFDIYAGRWTVASIGRTAPAQKGLFDSVSNITTSDHKAERVLHGLSKKLSKRGLNNLYKSYHLRQPDTEMNLLEYIRLVLSSARSVEADLRQAPVLRMAQMTKQMNREIHRMHAFVRFQKTTDNIYAAGICPDFDVMPFIGDHFTQRYADQRWLIMDINRKYGLYYDGQATDFVTMDNADWLGKGSIPWEVLADDELAFQDLWRQYFKATCIVERKNLSLHLRHMPRRYWSLLTEKRSD
jgi:probable DNA metabolism protein